MIIKPVEHNWVFIKQSKKQQETLIKTLGLHPIIANILINRGIKNISEAKKFLNPYIDDLYDPFLLKDMSKVVERIDKARFQKEKVLLFTDYDVDGVTSLTLLIKALEAMHIKTYHYLPRRLEEGYGLNKNGIDYAKKKKCSLIITADCGITSFEEIDYCKDKKIDIIVIDHHEPKEVLPKAYAILNPKCKNSGYPFKELAAVGIVFKLIQALLQKHKISINIDSILDLVALGTISDIVPLVEENRIIAKYGLKQLANTSNIGLQRLIKVSEIESGDINTGHVSFRLGPRINAAGRLSDADTALKLLLTKSKIRAFLLANELNIRNNKRQELQEEILEETLSIIKESGLDRNKVIVVAKEKWHKGVIGIVASKIVDIYHKPTIVVSLDENKGEGSGRSIQKFHLLNSLDYCKKELISYGGHEHAAGIKIKKSKLDIFLKKINEYANKLLKPGDLSPNMKIDSIVPLRSISAILVKKINLLEPFGYGNPYPKLCSTNLSLQEDPRVLKDKHIKLEVNDGYNSINTIGFNMIGYLDIILKNPNNLNIVYSPEINIWKNEEYLQLNLKDIKTGKINF